MAGQQYKVHSLTYRTYFLLGHNSELFGFLLQLLRGTPQLFGDSGQLLGLALQLLGRSRQLFRQNPPLIFQVLCIGLCKVSLASGSLDVSLREVHRLFEFFVLLGEGLHPLYQLAVLLSNPSYLLQMHNNSVDIQFQKLTRTFQGAVLTLIYLITPVREVSSLLNSLVVSSSSTTTISSPCFQRIRTD